jgi:hypothetical protein
VFVWSQFVQSLTAFLAAPAELQQASSGPVNGYSDPNLPVDWLFCYQQYACDLTPISVELCYVWQFPDCVGLVIDDVRQFHVYGQMTGPVFIGDLQGSKCT